jgi:hypothetical protein
MSERARADSLLLLDDWGGYREAAWDHFQLWSRRHFISSVKRLGAISHKPATPCLTDLPLGASSMGAARGRAQGGAGQALPVELGCFD